ncbi:hypothetical protein ABIC83_002978 [Roseateles asaccharophilus]|uniref:hypothetical protein n=1 Tax=Roseateles asaccharophilus TaxID=582607 RepID=UPI00383878B6
MRWIAAFNYPTRSWSTGGAEADYPRPHWDLYEVHTGGGRDRAQLLAQAQRRKHRALPAKQALLLASLLNDTRSVSATVAAETPWIEVAEAEVAAARGLVAKKLLKSKDDSCRLVQLTVSSLNQLGLPQQ